MHFCRRNTLKVPKGQASSQGQGQAHSKKEINTQGNKKIPPLNKQRRDSLGNCCVTDESNRL